MPVRQQRRLREMPDGSWRSFEIEVPNPKSTIENATQSLRGRRELEDAATILAATPGFGFYSRVYSGVPFRPEYVAARHFVMTLPSLVCAEEELALDEDRWRSVMDGLHRLAIDGTQRVSTFVPILGLRLTEPIDLGGMILRPLSAVERETVFNDPLYGSVGRMGNDSPPESALFIEQFLVAPESELTHRRRTDAQIWNLLLALRLWTGGSLFVKAIVRDVELGAGRSSRHGNNPPPTGPFVNLVDPAGFVAFWKKTQAAIAEPPKGLDVALRRFTLIHDQPRHSDRILDQVIILEALFLDRSEKQELSYRLRMRVAHFIGDTLGDRVNNVDLINAAYKMRSAIAHGDEPSAADENTQKELDRIIQRVLVRYLEEAATRRDRSLHQMILKDLDRRMLERA